MSDRMFEQLKDIGVEIDDTIERLMCDQELYVKYLHRFIDSSDYLMLKKAVEEKDSEAAIMAVHTLKGVALNLGLLPLSDACMDMLMDFRMNEPEKAYAKMDSVEIEFGKLADIISQDQQRNI